MHTRSHTRSIEPELKKEDILGGNDKAVIPHFGLLTDSLGAGVKAPKAELVVLGSLGDEAEVSECELRSILALAESSEGGLTLDMPSPGRPTEQEDPCPGAGPRCRPSSSPLFISSHIPDCM